MSLSIGIIGLPNVGKSTLFKALTKQQVDISNYPFCTINPNVGIVAVPDQRLEAIASIIKPAKITPAVIEFVDIAGLVKNAHQGEGLGNQFLARIRETDALCHVVRAFTNQQISHPEGDINPQRDVNIINHELIMKDLETINKRLEKNQKQAKSGDKNILKEFDFLVEIKNNLEQNQLLSDQSHPLIKELGLLTAKPIIYLFNIDHSTEQKDNALFIDLKTEADASEFSPQEIEELDLPDSKLDQLIKKSYQILDLITFFTIKGGQELRAWPLKIGSKAPQAGGLVHSDFEEGFIRAEVINWRKLIEAGSWTKARESGLLRIEGRDYLIQDGGVIEFKI